MEKGPPSWLDEEFLVEVLQNERSGLVEVEVEKISINLAVGAGNNYLSQIYRVFVEYKVNKEEQTTSLIIKVPITGGFIAEMQGNIPDTEPTMYSEILPKMNEKASHQFGPKSYNSSQKLAMVLQDLNADGYLMSDRFKRLSLSHCKVAFTTIAKFHASSVACYGENPESMESVAKERLYSLENQMQEKQREWMKKTVQGIAGTLTALGGNKESADLLLNRSENIGDNLKKIVQPKTNGLNVLNHGDLWTNNMLFKYDENSEVVDVKLIDFQLTRYSSPVLDLLYLIWTSADEDVCEHHLEELFQIYLTTLNETLKKIGCEEWMSEDEFNDDLKKSLDFAIITICQVLPFTICEEDSVINMEEVNSDDLQEGAVDERFQKVYSGKHFLTILPNLLKHLYNWFTALN